MIKQMALDVSEISMVGNMKDIGKKISNMVKVLRNGVMVKRNILENFVKVRNMDKESLSGMMDHILKAILRMDYLMVLVSITLRIVKKPILANSKMEKLKVREK